MTEVTKEMILDYLIKKGGVVKNVDLVRHFRKYLQVEDPTQKDYAREVFKERVNSVASIRADKGEKYLHLRPEIYKPQVGVTGLSSSKPPSGRTATDKSSVTSGDELSQLISDLLSPGPNSTNTFSEFSSSPSPQPDKSSSPYHSASDTGRGGASDSTMYSRYGKNDVVSQSYKPSSNSSWGASSTTPTYKPTVTPTNSYTSSRYTSPPPASTSTATPTTTSSSLFSPTSKSGTSDLGIGSLGGDLMSSFGDLFSSFGNSTSSSGLGGTSSSGLGGTSSSGLGGTSSNSRTNSSGLGGTSSTGLGGTSSLSNGLGGTRSSGLGGTSSSSGLGGTNYSKTSSLSGLGGTSSRGLGGSSSTSVLGGTNSTSLGGTSSTSRLGGTSSTNAVGGTSSSSTGYGMTSSSMSASSLGGTSPSRGYGGTSPSRGYGGTTSTSGYGGSSSTSGLGGTGSSLLGGSTSSSGVGGGTGSSMLDDIMSSSFLGGSGSSWTSNTTASQGQGQRSPRREPPTVPSTSTPQQSTNQTTSSSSISPQRRNSTQQGGSPRRPPPGVPAGGMSNSSFGSAGGMASDQQSMRKSPSGSLSSQGSPRRPPPGPPPGNSTTITPSASTESPRRAPPPAPSPKTSTSSIGPTTGGVSSSNNYNSNFEPPRGAPSSTSGGVSSAYAKYGSPYHSAQQNKPTSSAAPPTRVMSPPRVTSPPKTSPSKEKTTPTRGGTSAGSSLGGLGSLDFDLTSLPSFLDSSPKPKPVAPPVAPQVEKKANVPPEKKPSGPPASSAPSTVSSNAPPTVGGSSGYSGSSNAPSSGTSLHQPHHQLGPVVSAPTGKVGVADGSGHRQRSLDKTSRQYNSSEAIREQTPPTIRVHGSPRGSPDSAAGMSPPGREWRSKSPPYQSLGPHMDSRHRSHTTAMGHVINGSVSSSGVGVQLRNKDSKLRSSQANIRRSRNMEKRDTNLDSVTRLSIQMTPPTARRKPEVAPKPSPKPTHRSREDLSIDGDDMSMTEMSEQESWEIDPLEKDWMLASAQGDIQGLQQLLLEEPNLVNRKDFIHGYTALHWAAKLGRCDIIACLMLSGAQLDIKSNGGLTPLHLASLAGYDNAIEQLVRDFRANVNTRDYGGRRPIDMLSNKTTERSKKLLSQLYNHGLPTRVHTPDHLFTFSQPHRGANDGRLTRNWSSVGDMADRRIEHEKPHKRLPRMASIRKSFSIHSKKNKDYSPSKKDKRKRSSTRPVSDASAYAYNV